ncbi:MAG: hypothetical protein LBE38_09235 [Deltaproteobacteria bacterium]|jgi:hypothetical protein|nr:hypothetical protein [Deltaproteobacteria bacterium]
MRQTFFKTLPALLALVILTSCIGTSSRLNLTYNPIAGTTTINHATVQLVVVDGRQTPNLVGRTAQSQELFKGSQGGMVDFMITVPSGQTVSRSLMSVEQVVFEAVRERLRLLGVAANTGSSGAKCRVTVNIADFVLDVSGSDVVAHVRLEAVMDRPGYELVNRSWAEADSSRRKLIGDMGGADALSEALTMAVNRLNFASLDQY